MRSVKQQWVTCVPRCPPLRRRLAVIAGCVTLLVPVGVRADNSAIFSTALRYAAPPGSAGSIDAVQIGDFNSDGLNDVALTVTTNLYVSYQTRSGSMAAFVKSRTVGRDLSERFLAVGDFNSDGRDDIAVNCDLAGVVAIYLQSTNGIPSAPSYTLAYSRPRTMATGDFDGDRRDDLAVIQAETKGIALFMQTEGGTMAPAFRYYSCHDPQGNICPGDVDGDRRPDLVVADGQGLSPLMYVHCQKNGIGPTLAVSRGVLGIPDVYPLVPRDATSGIAIGDVNDDGANEIVITRGGNRPQAKLDVYARHGDGRFQCVSSYPAYDLPEPVKIADVDADGRNDVVVGHTGWERVSVYRQQPDGTLAAYELYPVPYAGNLNSDGLDLGDVNDDALPDVVSFGDFSTNELVVVLHAPATAPRADFLLRALPPRATITRDQGSNTWQFVITPRNGFSGDITFSVAGLPPEATAVFPSNPVLAGFITVPMSVRIGERTPSGVFPLTAEASASGVARTNALELTVAQDRDHDGLPDNWELAHFDRLADCAPGVDSDGDAASNALEWRAGTDPRDEDDYPVRLIVQSAPAGTGAPAPYGYGTNYVRCGATVTCAVARVTGEVFGSRYACTGWTAAGGITSGGTDCVATLGIPADTTLTFAWERQRALFQHQRDARTQTCVQRMLYARDPGEWELFGSAISVQGACAVMGAPQESQVATYAGSAHVFVRNGDAWQQQAKLLPSDPAYDGYFGTSVAIDGDSIVVGAVDRSSAAYLFARSGTNWVQQARLRAHDAVTYFGSSVAIDGDHLLVGSPNDDDNGNVPSYSGAAYVYRRVGANWVEEAKLTAAQPVSWDQFGNAVALKDHLAVVGTAAGVGAYVFRYDGTNWWQTARLRSSDGVGIGSSVAHNGSLVVVGSSKGGYVFRRDGTNWVQEAKLAVSGGTVVALAGNLIAVGAPNSEVACVFERQDTGWVQKWQLQASNAAFYDKFGTAVGLGDRHVFVGTPNRGDNGYRSGTVYTYLMPTNRSFADSVAWHPYGNTARTAVAPDVYHADADYRFAEWSVGGARQPSDAAEARNPVTTINMTAARVAVAAYFPETHDGDADGRPDWWKRRYFGAAAVPLTADSDGDGLTNSVEWAVGANPWRADTDDDGMRDGDERIAGTGPTDAGSALRVAPFGAVPAGQGASWQSVAGRSYTIEVCTNLVGGVWLPCPDGTGVAGNGEVLIYSNALPDSAQLFYRLSVQLAP